MTIPYKHDIAEAVHTTACTCTLTLRHISTARGCVCNALQALHLSVPVCYLQNHYLLAQVHQLFPRCPRAQAVSLTSPRGTNPYNQSWLWRPHGTCTTTDCRCAWVRMFMGGERHPEPRPQSSASKAASLIRTLNLNFSSRKKGVVASRVLIEGLLRPSQNPCLSVHS